MRWEKQGCWDDGGCGGWDGMGWDRMGGAKLVGSSECEGRLGFEELTDA